MSNLLNNFGFWYGNVCGNYPLRIVLLNFLIIIPSLSYFLIYPIKVDTDVRRGYAHKNGRASQELARFGEFYNVTPSNMELVFIIVESKNKSDPHLKLTNELINEIGRLDLFMKNLSVVMDYNNQRINFEELQGARGDINFIFKAFKWALNLQDDYLKSNLTKDSNIDLSYPNSKIYGHNISISGHFFYPKEHITELEKYPSKINTVEVITLWYMLQVNGPNMRPFLQKLELQLYEVAKENNFSNQFNFHLYGDELANYEMMRAGYGAIKLLVIGLILLILFVIYTLKDIHWKQKIILVVAAILSPLLAIVNAFGVLGWIGYDINSIMCIMPFLILGIGVDDAFLLLHSWQKWSLKKPKIECCMAEVINEIGPSITITSVTNMLAFSIGIFSPAPQLSAFCLSTTIAVCLDYFFEFLLFVPFIVFSDRLLNAEEKLQQIERQTKRKKTNFWSSYARFIISKAGRSTCLFLMVFMYVMAYFGIQKMQVTFDPQKTFPQDSYLSQSLRVIERMMEEYAPLTFIVNKAPNISDHLQLGEFFTMIEEMENLPNTYGSEKTEIWLRKYLEYDFAKSGLIDYKNYTPTYERVPEFLVENLIDDKFVVKYHYNGNKQVVVEKFTFVLICHGKRNWHQRAYFVDDVRRVVDKYVDFQVSVFDYDATIFDLILTVQEEMFKAVLVTLACMTVVCFFIIPSFKHTGIAILAVLSISYTLLGALGWWNLDMDPVTMINVLMAIGFSVDFSAHICYHYYILDPSRKYNLNVVNEEEDEVPIQKINQILNSIGKPMIEAASSTLISLMPLFFISIYLMTAFAKTVVCVCVLGTIHGLFIVPTFLSWQFENPNQKILSKRKNLKETKFSSILRVNTETLLNSENNK